MMLEDGFWGKLLEGGFRDVCVSWMALLKEVDGGTHLPSHEEARPRVLSFYEDKGDQFQYVPIIKPNDSLYDGLSFNPPSRSDEFDTLFSELYKAFERAKGRGINPYMFDDKGYFETAGYPANPDGTRGFLCWNDPQVAEYLVARTRDYANQFGNCAGRSRLQVGDCPWREG